MSVFPELVTGREDEVAPGPWRVERGAPARGRASCDLVAHVLEVPLGDDVTSRVVRAHELVHARVSPHPRHLAEALAEVDARALECAEELRVNVLLARLGHEVGRLVDGSERPGGERVAGAGDWAEAVCFAVAVAGTGAERPFFAGVRRVRPEWVAGLRATVRAARARVEGISSERLGATAPDELGRPRGFVEATLEVARLLTRAMGARAPSGPEELRRFRRALADGARRPPSGRFAELALVDARLLARPVMPSLRRTRPSVTGVDLRYPSRLVTDPLRRAFAGPARAVGGVVLVDQSGSMAVDTDELAGLVRRSPGALVIGYSHRPGDHGVTPNAWVLVAAGRVAVEIPPGNVGNGVDGPALRLALAERRRGEPVVWVTDGQVTDSNDHPDDALALECARLVERHGVVLARTLAGAAAALRARGRQSATERRSFGRVGSMIALTRE
ncbi:MAG: hypothetical protein ACYCRG_03745 [Acidimicrobiales bacterium]